MGKQDEKHPRSGDFYSWMLLLRAVHDTGRGIIDSSEVLSGTSLLLLVLLRF